MAFNRIPLLIALVAGLAACESQAEKQADAVERQIEKEAKASAAAAGDALVALNLTERQLLDADLLAADGTELGDIVMVQRDPSGAVSGLLVEVEDSDPDRFVVVPLAGLTTRPDGAEFDVVTTMTARDIAALPDAPLPTPAPKR